MRLEELAGSFLIPVPHFSSPTLFAPEQLRRTTETNQRPSSRSRRKSPPSARPLIAGDAEAVAMLLQGGWQLKELGLPETPDTHRGSSQPAVPSTPSDVAVGGGAPEVGPPPE